MAHWLPHLGGRQPSSNSSGRQKKSKDGPSTDLFGGLDVHDAAALRDWDSSDSDTQTSLLRPAKIQHGRSLSNPFPSIFDTANGAQPSGSRPQATASREERAYEQNMASKTGRSPRKDSTTKDKEFSTGNCMTCASLVRWPMGLDVFKCTICATVNDLTPREHASKSHRGYGRGRVDRPGQSQREDRDNSQGKRRHYNLYTAIRLTHSLKRNPFPYYTQKSLYDNVSTHIFRRL